MKNRVKKTIDAVGCGKEGGGQVGPITDREGGKISARGGKRSPDDTKRLYLGEC